MILEQRILPGGLSVSAQGYGAMSLSDAYGPISETGAARIISASRDAGVTFFDTANIYGDGRSETLLGRAFSTPTERDSVTIATKFGIVRGGGVGHRGIRGDRAYVHAQVDASLRRLQTDHIDLLYQHRVDRDVGIEETVGAMSELVTAGKVRHLGLSEASGSEVRRANNIHPITVVQSEWNLFSRDIETNVLPTLVELEIAVVPYAPLSRGLLTGKISPFGYERPDIRSGFPRFTSDNLPFNRRLANELSKEAHAVGLSLAQLSLAWITNRSAEIGIVCVPIPGTRSPTHLRENLESIGAKLDRETLRRLDRFADDVAGPRNADRRWISQDRD